MVFDSFGEEADMSHRHSRHHSSLRSAKSAIIFVFVLILLLLSSLLPLLFFQNPIP
jgi:hypothetical protein